VVDGHGIDGNRSTRVDQFTDSLASFWFIGDLLETIVGAVAGGFGVEEMNILD
jgi:hypothetical protein